jgi:hypothetical protein
MRHFTPRTRPGRTRTTRTPRSTSDRALRTILSGPDTAHRRELETMLEDAAR